MKVKNFKKLVAGILTQQDDLKLSIEESVELIMEIRTTYD